MKKAVLRSTGDDGKKSSQYSLGLVLSGGGSFGAWEAGALQALWKVWAEKHGGEDPPPIRVVAATSAGALSAPFALGRREHVDHVARWWTNVEDKDISVPSLGLFLPAVQFLKYCSGLGDFGDPKATTCKLPRTYRDFLEKTGQAEEILKPNRSKPLLYGNYKSVLKNKNTLELCRDAWPGGRRLGIATVDFVGGIGDVVTNSPKNTSGADLYESRLFRGIFASAITPMIGYPVQLQTGDTSGDPIGPEAPHFDGGVYSEAPFGILFRLAALKAPIQLTHVIVIASYPLFPGETNPNSPQQDPFPNQPNFEKVGLRFDALLSEASATKDIALARTALRLRTLGESERAVEMMTGLAIPDPVPAPLIEAVPKERMGWDNSRCNKTEMGMMEALGREEAAEKFRKTPPEGLP